MTRLSLPRTITLVVVAAGLSTGLAAIAYGDDPTPAATVRPALDGNRGPFEIAFTPDGSRAVVTEFDEGALAIIETASGKVLQHVPTGGEEPTGVAVTPDGKQALVTNTVGGSLAFVELGTGKSSLLPLPGMPYDVVVSPDGKTAYVSISQLDQVAVVDLERRQVAAQVPTGRRPRALSLTPDGRVLVTANLTQGSATFIDTAGPRVIGEGPTPAVNLRGVAVYPEGRRAYVIGQRAQNERPTETAIGIWSNQSFLVAPNGPRNGLENIWLDLVAKDPADPESVVLDLKRGRAYITCGGGHSVNAVGLADSADVKAAAGVGAGPKGLAFTPDGKELWVANLLGNDVAVLDPDTLAVKRRISLGPTARKDPHLEGRFLFNSATIVNGGQFSCNSCHPDGNTDGISWKFVHVQDVFGKQTDRNVRSLRGELADTAPFRWTGHDADLVSFVKHELPGLLQSPPMTDAQVSAIVEYLKALRLPPNPYRTPDGKLTEAGERGKILFEGKAGCAACHSGPKAGANRPAWVGTTAEGIQLDIPHLAGVYDSYPYLHDGRAKTLEEIFSRHNPSKLHGKADTLTEDELKELLDYVKQL
jgi:YVTN family beta-propeller protein